MNSTPACPHCEMNEVLNHGERWECMTCGHEWERVEPVVARVVTDAYGTFGFSELRSGMGNVLVFSGYMRRNRERRG